MTPQDKQAFGEGGNFTIVPGDGEIDLGAEGLRAVAIQCVEETSFNTLIDACYRSSLASSDPTDLTYPAGFTLYGDFSVIDLSSGSARVTLASDRK